MTSMYMLIILALCVGIAAWLLFLWAVKSGQYDDMEGPKYRMLDDDDEKDDSVKNKENAVKEDSDSKQDH